MGEFLQFVGTLRSNNLGIPILVGGDFNMDMKSYDMERYKDLSIVPYRPLSGKNVMRDLRNTFLFTMDALQVMVQSAKQLQKYTKLRLAAISSSCLHETLLKLY